MKKLSNWAPAWAAFSILICLLVNADVLADALLESTDTIPQQCSTDCKTRYGSEIGKSPAGVSAYSNCNSNCVIFEPNHRNDVYTGIKWQCVEYARRWLLSEQSVVFGDVDIAADIWGMQQVNNPFSKQVLSFDSIVNGAAELPQRGDLLIYGKDYLGTGHVAVVVAIDEKLHTIKIAEQNFSNTKWQAEYAREIAYTKSENRIWLLDPYLIGWKRVAQVKH
ncbi:MAG: CHAP domain-containing protein [Gammaproteobacteria bacterium]|nr:MAG: CHAP domain-containing protein [Gammaproteobacteria bacterium]